MQPSTQFKTACKERQHWGYFLGIHFTSWHVPLGYYYPFFFVMWKGLNTVFEKLVDKQFGGNKKNVHKWQGIFYMVQEIDF